MRLLSSITLLFISAAFSVQTLAASLGEINVRSNLNQPLDASIPIKLSTPGEGQGMKVMLSSGPGIENGEEIASPSDLVLTIDNANSANPRILLTTKKPVVEPAFSIFILLETKESRILGEFSLLLDLPGENLAKEPISATTPQPKAEASKEAPKEAAKTASPSANVAQPGTYTPAKNETLWSIASKLRPSKDVPVQVMIKALADTNPDAFNNGNINTLKKGYTLTIPGNEVLRGITREQAIAFVEGQPGQSSRTVTPAAPTPDATAATTESADNAQQVSALDDPEKRYLLEHIAQLQQKVDDMQAMLEEQKQQAAVIEPEATVQAETSAASVTTATTVETEQAPAATTPVEAAATPAPQMQNNEAVPQNVAKPVVKKPAPIVEPPAEEPSLLEQIPAIDGIIKLVMENNAFFAVGAAVMLLLGVLMTYRAKRNAEQMASYAVSAHPMMMGDDKESADEVMSITEAVSVEDSSENENLDRLVEIDVYLAYGRFKEAEALANEGIAAEPTRPDYYLKLFEVYKASDNKSAFESAAESFFSGVGAEHPDAWSKVVAMGKSLCSTHPLFLDLDKQESETPQDASGINQLDDFLQPSEPEPIHHASDIITNNPVVNELSLAENEAVLPDLPDETKLSHETPVETAEEIAIELQSESLVKQDEVEAALSLEAEIEPEAKLDVALDSEDIRQPGEEVAERDLIDRAILNLADEENSTHVELDKPLVMDEDIELPQQDAFLNDTVSEQEENNVIEFARNYAPDVIINDDSVSDIETALTDDLIINTAADEFLKEDLSSLIENDSLGGKDPLADLNDTIAALEEIEHQGEEYGQQDALDQEAVETKLDLVRAYIEMDDQEEARRILDEILSEGNDEQKQKAEELIRQIA